MSTHNHTTASLSDLASFGDVAAEDDAVLDYFVKTEAFSRIERNEVFLVLGRKGAGKTALVRFFAEGSGPAASKSLSLKGYPWNIHASRIDKGASEIEAYVSSWRYLICLQLAMLARSRPGADKHPKSKALTRFLTDNYGGVTPSLSDVLKPPKLRFSGASFEPEVLGFKLGSIDFEQPVNDLRLGTDLNALSDMLLDAAVEIAGQAGIPALLLHFDELDQGLTSLDTQRSRMLIGLILAAREVRQLTRTRDVPVNAVVYLRTDLWDDLKFSDKNKISQTLALNLEWTPQTLLDLVNERLRARLASSASWETITTTRLMRGRQTKWNQILSRTFLRPRDVIKFLNAALQEAKNRPEQPLMLDNIDVINARENYSSYLKAELDDEIIAHWPQWEEALQACSAISTITFRRDEFEREYGRRSSPSNGVLPNEALSLLYRFSVIGYERRKGYGGTYWAFQYTNPEAGWDSGATVFKVHLGLKEYAKLREERSTAGT